MRSIQEDTENMMATRTDGTTLPLARVVRWSRCLRCQRRSGLRARLTAGREPPAPPRAPHQTLCRSARPNVVDISLANVEI